MNEGLVAFLIWSIVGLVIIIIGIIDMFLKKPAGFWANADSPNINQIQDIKGYNRATGFLFISYGVIFILLGIPLLKEDTIPLILLSTLGVMFETIGIMAIYTIVIVKKYIKN